VAFALKGVTDERLASCVEKIHWFEWGDFKKAVLVLATERIKKIILLGKIEKDLLFKEEGRLDAEAKKVLENVKDKKDYSILKGVAKVLAAFGVEILDSTTHLDELLPSKGVLTKRSPTPAEKEDIEYGLRTARELAGRDIGQAVAVKDKTVISVEGVEGTDAAIKRAGELTGGGFTVVKAARPDQDMRFDVPVVGPGTMQVLIKSGGRCLAMEGRKMFLLDKDEVVRLADASGISIVVI
jgi:DUF1009 family protein